MKKISILICALVLISCNSKKNHDTQKVESENNSLIEKQAASKNTPYIIVKVSDRNSERIEVTEDFSPAELRTTRLKNGKLNTTFQINLGSFEDENYYRLSLLFAREAEKPDLKVGKYRLITVEDGVKLQPETDFFFASTNTFGLETFNNIKLTNRINDFPDEFYAPLNDENVLEITSAEDPVETEESNDIISEHFQGVKGYLVFNIIKIQTGKSYTVRVDFDVDNEIRIFQ